MEIGKQYAIAQALLQAHALYHRHSISPFHRARHRQRASRRGKATREGEDFYNLAKERLRNYFLTMHISLKTTKGEESFKLGIGFGSRSDSHKTITDKFHLEIKR